MLPEMGLLANLSENQVLIILQVLRPRIHRTGGHWLGWAASNHALIYSTWQANTECLCWTF